MSRCFLVAFLVLLDSSLLAHGTGLDRDELGDLGSGLVRREAQKVKHFQNSARRGRSVEDVVDKGGFFSEGKERDASRDLTICNENFVVGNSNSSGHCLSDHTHIITEQLCKDAAEAVKAPLGTPFSPPRAQNAIDGNRNTHPKGCYAKTVLGQVTYHFNEISDEIPTPYIEADEAAVCRRDKLKLGTVDTNECPSSEYKILFNEGLCEDAAVCLRYMHDQSAQMDFDVVVMDMTEHDIFPAGCFVQHTKQPHEPKAVFYNPEKQGAQTLELPGNPQGTIICIAESVDLGDLNQLDESTSGAANTTAAPEMLLARTVRTEVH